MKFLRVNLSNANFVPLKRRGSQKDSTFQCGGTRLLQRRRLRQRQEHALFRLCPVLSWPICGYTVVPAFDGLSINGQIGSWSRTAPGTDASLRSTAINFTSTSPDYLALRGLPGPWLVHGFPATNERIPWIWSDRRLIVTTRYRSAHYDLIKAIAPFLVNIFNLKVLGPFWCLTQLW